MFKTEYLPRARRHTYYFLQHAREFSPVYLSTGVDVEKVLHHREAAKREGFRVSYVAYLIRAVSRVLAKYPEANTAVRHGFLPQLVRYDRIAAKFTVDKRIGGMRAVVSGIILDSDRLSLREIQGEIDLYRDLPFETIEALRPVRLLQWLPLGIGQWVYNRTLASFNRRHRLQGSFCVTSLGGYPVKSFFPVIASTLTFGMGRIEEKPVVLDGKISIRPVLPLSLTFDHRAIDGAMAADILANVKQLLEAGIPDSRGEG